MGCEVVKRPRHGSSVSVGSTACSATGSAERLCRPPILMLFVLFPAELCWQDQPSAQQTAAPSRSELLPYFLTAPSFTSSEFHQITTPQPICERL